MARRRMLSENLLYDPSFNSLSIEAQCLFIRMIIKTDDYGILPGDQFSMLNLPKRLASSLEKLIAEIVEHGLIVGFIHEEKPFFAFKRDRFDDYQSYLIAKRTRSEYLRLEKDDMEGNTFQDILRNSWKFLNVTPSIHRKYKAVSTKYKAESKKSKESDFQSVWETYPNRVGRPQALRHFEATVNTPEDLEKIRKALTNYLTSGNVANGYIQNGSTWFNQWQDWVEPTEAMMKGNSNGTKTDKRITTANLERSAEMARKLAEARRARGE